MAGGGKIPTFQVRFESEDDFLVEYSDHLTKGVLVLPLGDVPAAGTAVRVKLVLPDDVPLFLTGVVDGADASLSDGDALIRLDPLSAEQNDALEACAHRTPVPTDPAAADPASTDVILVDDSVSVRLTLGDLLRKRGFRVRVAENGLEALSAALKRRPDVILTDVEMPVMDGWKLLQMVRGRPRLAHIPVIFLTRLSDEMSRLRGYRMGVDDFVPKDTPPEEVVARLSAVTDRTHRVGRGPAAAQGLRGDLLHVRLGSVLAFLEAEQRSGELHLTDGGGDKAVMHIRKGMLAKMENLGKFDHPHDRVFELLSWGGGEFEFFAGEETDVADGAVSLGYLIMEHARRQDEAR